MRQFMKGDKALWNDDTGLSPVRVVVDRSTNSVLESTVLVRVDDGDGVYTPGQTYVVLRTELAFRWPANAHDLEEVE